MDWLADAGQSWWQILPVTPPDRHGSPYKSPSAFAGWPGLLAKPTARVTAAEAAEFRERNAAWIDGWVRFAGDGALEDQVRFDREWGELRAYAQDRGVRIMGDLPFYVAPARRRRPRPPAPLPRRRGGRRPPGRLQRLRPALGQPDVRLAGDARGGLRLVGRAPRPLARPPRRRPHRPLPGVLRRSGASRGRPHGAQRPLAAGPAGAPIEAAIRELGPLALVAEDLGVITEPVHRLIAGSASPACASSSSPSPAARPTPTCRRTTRSVGVAYAGTHDNDTAVGWWESVDDDVRAAMTAAAARRGVEGEPPHRMLIRMTLGSPAGLAIVTAQDVLGLGAEARMNPPGAPAAAGRGAPPRPIDRVARQPGCASRRTRRAAPLARAHRPGRNLPAAASHAFGRSRRPRRVTRSGSSLSVPDRASP